MMTVPAAPTTTVAAQSDADRAALQAAGVTFLDIAQRSTLPVPPARYIPTADVNKIRFALRNAIRTGNISLIDGPRGVGKTTGIVESVRLHKTAHPIYVNLIDARTPSDAMRQIWEAHTGERARERATAYDIRDDLTRELRHRDVVLMIDDAHNLNALAMRTVLSLWDRTHTQTGRGLPTLLVGNGLVDKLGASIPELISRAPVAITVGKMRDKDLMEFLLALEPGIEGRSPRVLQDINRLHLKGRIRKWIQFFDLIRDLRNQHVLDGPIDSREARNVIAYMPVINEKADN